MHDLLEPPATGREFGPSGAHELPEMLRPWFFGSSAYNCTTHVLLLAPDLYPPLNRLSHAEQTPVAAVHAVQPVTQAAQVADGVVA